MESGGAAMAFLLWDKKIKIFLWLRKYKADLWNNGFVSGC